MNVMFRMKIFVVCACLAFGARIFADDTNSVSPPPPTPDAATQNALNGYLQIQQQLHETQLAVEKSREDAADAAQRNADAMTARIQALENTIAAEREGDVEAARETQHLTLSLVAAFGAAGLGVMLLMVYFQWRVVKRLVELPAAPPQAFALGNVQPPLLAGTAVGESTARLFGVVEHLQRRILELEQGSRGALTGKNPAAKDSTGISEIKNGDSAPKDRDGCIGDLIAEGQALLDANNAVKALECFDAALALDAKHVEALVKKGGALEKLGRTDEAIACYDRAIEADNSATIAYLQKGGLFNRLARYDEALLCYERALHTHEKTPVAKV